MESHILNTYHQARYRTIGHKVVRSSESLSSEGSCNRNSPEYQRKQEYGRQYADGSQTGYWSSQDWSRNQTINMTRSQDTSSDEEEQIEVQDVSFDERATDNLHLSEPDTVEDNTLVEGDDYDVIQVYAVDPDLDLEASSDEEHEDFAIKPVDDNAEYISAQEHSIQKSVSQCENQGIPPDVLNFNLDTPVVSNVDEYFIKEDKDILAVKDEPVVKDVDEYFIKEDKPKIPIVDDFFVKNKLAEEEPQFDVPPKPVNVDEFFVTNPTKVPPHVIQPENVEVPINETDLEVLPNIEELKRFLLEDMTYSKFKNAQRSCSLPQSPMHNICLDIDDAKTCLSFEDLNLDLSDLAFDNDKDKSGNKSDDIPTTLTEEDVNSFLITEKPDNKEINDENQDDLSHQDMELDRPVESIVDPVKAPEPAIKRTSTPIPKPNVLDFCIEKKSIKKEKADAKVEVEDFVDVESCNDVVIPVLEANNLNSLLEQFEATEKLNTNKPKKPVIKIEEQKVKNVSLTNGMRLQDAGVQLNKNKMRQILMPSTINATVRRSPSPVHSDHDYCSSKKRYSLPNIKGGQSLLKPEVLSSNSRILNSRHRSCKSKKIIYNLSSDDESDKRNDKNKKLVSRSDDSDIKVKKPNVKQTVKVIHQPNARKKLSPVHSAINDFKDKGNISVIVKDACKASDTPCSQNSNGSIKLTIKNKSEVILNCDDKDSQKDKIIEKCKSSVSEKTVKVEAQTNVKNKSVIKEEKVKHIKELDSNKGKSIGSIDNYTTASIKEEPRPKAEHFYTALFSNKQDVQVPQAMQVKTEKRSFEEEISIVTNIANKIETEQPTKKKKLNLQEYKLRRGVSSNNSSATVSPEAIFPDLLNPFHADKIKQIPNQTPPNGITNTVEQISFEAPKKLFDPIREASRKILMNTKKQKAEAMRKRDEDIVMSKIPKVENLELQPLISDAEMMKIVGMTPVEVPAPIANGKPQTPAEYEEIVMVSVGVNTDENVFKELEKSIQKVKKPPTPTDTKGLINFKIKKSDHVLKQNVFDSVKRDKRSLVDDKKHTDIKIDKERYKDITATLKSVEKQVDPKISSNSLFASIQDVVMKKAPDEISQTGQKTNDKRSKSNSPKRIAIPRVKTAIVRDYDVSADHGEDKIILHLGKDRRKPNSSIIAIQTDAAPEFVEITPLAVEIEPKARKRNDSDMSMSSEGSPERPKKESRKSEEKVACRTEKREAKRSQSKEKRSRSRERYDKFRRSRSPSRDRRRRRSHSRSRSRSRGRYRRYRRSDSPYRRKRRSRSPYRSRRSPSVRRERDYRVDRSRSRTDANRSKSPIGKKKSPVRNGADKKCDKSLTPPPRKPTVSESSGSSSRSSSSSSSDSQKSGRSSSPYRRDEFRKKEYRSPYSSEDRESNTPVEERRIVFVGKLEKDITKSGLRSQFSKFGAVMEVRLHSKEDGSRYGFVTYQRARDAWSAVEAASSFPQYDVGFGGRRAFCRQSYADLDGLEAKYTESAFHGQAAAPPRRNDDMSFEQMLLEMKKKLSQRKNEKRTDE